MKIIRSTTGLLLLAFLLINTSCNKEEEGYFVKVEIVAPESGAAIQKGAPFSVEVKYARNEDIIHNVLIEILDDKGHRKMKLIERHVHELGSFTFQQDNIVIEEAGTYTLRAYTSDMHNGQEEGEHMDGAHEEGAEGSHEEDENNTLERRFFVE